LKLVCLQAEEFLINCCLKLFFICRGLLFTATLFLFLNFFRNKLVEGHAWCLQPRKRGGQAKNRLKKLKIIWVSHCRVNWILTNSSQNFGCLVHKRIWFWFLCDFGYPSIFFALIFSLYWLSLMLYLSRNKFPNPPLT